MKSPIIVALDYPELDMATGMLDRLDPDMTRVKVGKETGWYPNGKVQFEGSYRDGKKHGTWTQYHENGVKAEEARFRNGVPAGAPRRWDEAGNPL